MRRLVAFAPFVVLLAALLASCGGDGKPSILSGAGTPSNPGSTPGATAVANGFPGKTWQLVYGTSGGIAGRVNTTTLESSGKATFIYGLPSSTVTATLPADQMERLKREISAANLASIPPGKPVTCADCISTYFRFTSDVGKVDIVLGTEKRSAAFESLLQDLDQIYNANNISKR